MDYDLYCCVLELDKDDKNASLIVIYRTITMSLCVIKCDIFHIFGAGILEEKAW